MLSPKEKELYDSVGKRIKATIAHDDVFIGHCTEFTDAYDNEPEEASITLRDPEKNGKSFPGLIELFLNEIKSIEVLD
ncbi:hypothetical protein FYJ53_20590 [Eubacterium sp. BL-380-WT-2B]|uniref:hypothetical protein n=1 Tax=Eubacterium sp. BL-380-WT-2B TaxID=2605785 RepID=UPI0012B3C778|nr:hypothetical protein [Eubacterium sp. BL-380-WT-2B]MSS96153.1 hypothetical protein [Eubacterium sp. BL-380-WT-2B]